MSLSSRTLLATAALAAAVVAPSAANAAEGFTAVTSSGDVARLQSDSAPGLRGVHKVSGLAAGERIAGLDRTPSGELLALTSKGRIATLDRATGKATPKFAGPVVAAVDPDAALTFAVTPDGAGARIITAGRDVTVNLATGAVTNGPGLTFAAGDPHAGAQATPALDFAADGRLIGIAAAQATYAAQTAPGAATLQSTANVPYKAIEPTRATVASDGSVWTASNLSDKPKRVPQSRLVGFNPATGAISGQNGAFLGVRIDALADDGQVADDTKAPKATFSASFLQRHAVRGHSIWTGLRVRTSEGGQTVATLRLRGKIVGFGLITRYQAGRSTLEIGPNRSARTALERAARQHRRAVVHLTVHDWAGNTRVYDHVVTLSL